MSPPHIHLMFNHVPILGAIYGTLLLLFGLGRGNDTLKRTGLVCFVLAGALAVPVFFSGRWSDHLVNHVAGVVDDYIDPHEAAAEWSLWLSLALAVIALIGLILYRQAAPWPSWFTGICVLLALVTSGSMAYTGLLGGVIHHPELRAGWVPPTPGPSEEAPPKGKPSASPQ